MKKLLGILGTLLFVISVAFASSSSSNSDNAVTTSVKGNVPSVADSGYSEIDQRVAEHNFNSLRTAKRQLAEQGVLADHFEITSKTYPQGFIDYLVTKKPFVCGLKPLKAKHPYKLVTRCEYQPSGNAVA